MGLCVQGRAARNRGLVTLGSKDRNLESPRKSTLDFQEAGRDINDSRATRTKNHGRRLSRSVALTMSIQIPRSSSMQLSAKGSTSLRGNRVTSIATCLRTAVCAQQPHGVATVYDRKTGEIRGGGSPSHLSHHGFRADARSPITDTRLKREGGTFHFSLRNFTEQSTWLWQFRLECASHSLMLFGLRALPSYRFQGGNRKEIRAGFPFKRTDPSR